MSYREIDGKRDQFRKYIESKGVIDGITKVLIKLLETPEKPEHPMDFIRANLGATQADENRIASLEKEVDDYKKEVSELKTQLEAVKVKLCEFEKQTDTVNEAAAAVAAAADTKKGENCSNVPVESTEVKGTESNQINSVGSATNCESGGGESTGGGGAKVDAVNDKSVTDSEKAAKPSSNAATVDSANVSNESENADTGKSSSAPATSNDDGSKSVTASIETATNDGEKKKSDSGSDKTVPATNSSDKDK